jgi:hypothetical protein
LTWKYLREFSKKFEVTLTLFSGAWVKMIHEKEAKNLATLPFKGIAFLRRFKKSKRP